MNILADLSWECLNLAKPSKKHWMFDKVLDSEKTILKLLLEANVSVAPGVAEALTAKQPPTRTLFDALPEDVSRWWGVYLMVLTKDECQDLVYVGTGTNAHSGIRTRFRDYDINNCIPARVSKALKSGYKVAKKGLLCWAPLPAARNVPDFRILFLVLEAMCTFRFWIFPREAGFGSDDFQSFCPWDKSSLNYRGLCTHSPLNEGPVDVGEHFQTPEELEKSAREKAVRIGENVERCRQKSIQTDPAKHYATVNSQAAIRRKERPDSYKMAEKRCRSKAIKENRFKCDVCKSFFGRKPALTRHLRGVKHAAKVAELKGPHKAQKHFCKVCEMGFTRRENLKEHLATQRHAKRAAAALLDDPGAISQTELPVKKEVFYCELFDAHFADKRNMEIHLTRRVHTDKVAASLLEDAAGIQQT